MALARTDGPGATAAILNQLAWHNRFVSVLRLAVPVIGVMAFLVLAGEIFLANISAEYGVSGIRIDRGNLVVETPQYSGMNPDGARYLVIARQARAALDNAQVIAMTDARLDYQRPGKPMFHVTAADATTDTVTSVVTIPGLARVGSDDGLKGDLHKVTFDAANEITVADGPVDLVLQDGSHITAAGMRHDGKAQVWTFTRATLVVPELPRDDDAATGGTP